MPSPIRIGPATIPAVTAAWIAAVWLGTYVAERECKRRDLAALGPEVWNVVALATAATVISARLIYVGQNVSAFASDWLQLFTLAPQTLSLDLGILFGLVAAYAYVQRRRIPLAPFLDVLAPGALTAVMIVAVGQWLAGDAYGAPTNLPWAVFVWEEWRHPVQLYDALAAAIGLLAVWRLTRGDGRPPTSTTRAMDVGGRREGSIALGVLAWYSAARVFVEAFRADPAVLPGGFRSIQVVALVILVVAIWNILQPGVERPV